MRPGDKVLCNAFTLSPVPGAIHNAGGVPLLVETAKDYTIDLNHLRELAQPEDVSFLMLSHMRGHICDMDELDSICGKNGITYVEDCAHTMGASWKGRKSGTHGAVACYSTQTYKHLNSGEGGLLITADDQIMARAVIHSGSYMLYGRHEVVPDEAVFRQIRLETPNYSGRMDNLRAAILRPQLKSLDENCRRWNALYAKLEEKIARKRLDLCAEPPRLGRLCGQLNSVLFAFVLRGTDCGIRRAMRETRRRDQMVRRLGANRLYQPL